MDEFWVCPSCHSLTRRQAARCYHCRAPRPRDGITIAAGARGAVATPGVDERPAGFGGARTRRMILRGLAGVIAALTVPAIAAVVVLGIHAVARSASFLDVDSVQALQAALADPARSAADPADPMLATVFLVFAALAAGAWLVYFAVTVVTVPALAAGVPSVGLAGAVAWWFIPVFAWWRPYRMVNDVYEHLAVPGSPGSGIVAAWWTASVLGTLVTPGLLLLAVIGTAAGNALQGPAPVASLTHGLIVLDVASVTATFALVALSGVLFLRLLLVLERCQSTRQRWLASA